jgi:hypothetical protein
VTVYSKIQLASVTSADDLIFRIYVMPNFGEVTYVMPSFGEVTYVAQYMSYRVFGEVTYVAQ